ncbi:hAT family dimerization domain protein, partial [Metarhizium robertsii]
DGQHWFELEKIELALKDFYVATLLSEGRKTSLADWFSTLDCLLREINETKDHYHDIHTEDDNNFTWTYPQGCADAAWSKCAEYYNNQQLNWQNRFPDDTDLPPAYYAAQILDPYRKWAWFRQEGGFDNAQSAVKELWETEYKGRYRLEMLPPSGRKERDPDPAFDRQREHKRIRIDAPVSAADPYEQYISTDRLHDDEAGCDEAIAYWLSRYDSQRDLARFALDLFAISPMSDECERLFSSAKLTVVDRRGRLKADIIEACECLRAWYGKPDVEGDSDSEDIGRTGPTNRSDQSGLVWSGLTPQTRLYEEGSIKTLYTRVLVDGGIRWNSAYTMIERALKLRHAIDLFFLNYNHTGKEYDISQDMLTPQDWIDLKHFLDILKPFKDLTKRMEGRANKAGLEGSHGSLHETIESLDVLFKELQEAGKFADNHPQVVSTYYSYAIDAARIKLEEYFGLTDATPAYRCAVALHPANKFAYFELEWSHNKKWISEAKRVVREVYAQYEEEAAKRDVVGAQPQEEVIADDDVALDPLQQARKRRQRLAATVASGSLGAKRIKLTSELDEFMARANRADVEVEDPLEWWVAHAADYPILSKMAFDLFSCPAMSAECERVFSQAKKVVTDERNRLQSDIVAAIECQKHLLRTCMLS